MINNMRESLLEKENEEGMECDMCGKRKTSVSERPNAYANEIGNDPAATHTVCDECNYQNMMDI